MKELSHLILKQLDEAAMAFSSFQQRVKSPCPPTCGQCCLKADVSCNPYELLPLAYYLEENNLAEDFLEKACAHKNMPCLFLQNNSCSAYLYRPFVCRAFGVAARRNKHGQTDYSICSILKENAPENNLLLTDPPYIEEWKRKIETIDPRLIGHEFPINRALTIILEKILLLKSLENSN